jgi:hypothetical protein
MKISNVTKITFHRNESKQARETIKNLRAQGFVQIGDTGYSDEGIRIVTLTGEAIG